MNVNQYVIATLRRQRVIFSAAVAGIEDVDADVDIMMMTTKWWYGESNADVVIIMFLSFNLVVVVVFSATNDDGGGRWRLNKHALYKGK